MTRKFLGLLASLACITGILVGITATPASAAGCVTDNRSFTDHWSHGKGTWAITPTIFMQSCTSTAGDRYARVSSYRVNFNRVSSECDNISGWRFNPDILGPWNPAEKEINTCSGTLSWTAPAGMVVWASASWDVRCIGTANAEAKINLLPDVTVDVPNLCAVA